MSPRGEVVLNSPVFGGVAPPLFIWTISGGFGISTCGAPAHMYGRGYKMLHRTQHTQTTQQSLRILIVEDEREVLDMLREVLTGAGHAVVAAQDGEAALACFQAQPFDIVFTDLYMPGVSGWEVAGRIKNLNCSVPVVLLTGWDVELEKAALKTKGIDCFIKKPFAIAAILQALVDLCGPCKKAG